MCREEKDGYLKMATYILAYTNVRYSVSMKHPCKAVVDASHKSQKNKIWRKHEHYDFDPDFETLTLTGSAELLLHMFGE